jgi:hypothetical protein
MLPEPIGHAEPQALPGLGPAGTVARRLAAAKASSVATAPSTTPRLLTSGPVGGRGGRHPHRGHPGPYGTHRTHGTGIAQRRPADRAGRRRPETAVAASLRSQEARATPTRQLSAPVGPMKALAAHAAGPHPCGGNATGGKPPTLWDLLPRAAANRRWKPRIRGPKRKR